jgi:dUTP pyrophosphatase
MSSFDSSVQDLYNQLKQKFFNTSKNFAILKLHVANPVLAETYNKKVEEHNMNFLQNMYMDSGFDLFTPTVTEFTQPFVGTMINLDVKAEMVHCDVDTNTLNTCGYYVFPRSSISKTPLMLANHTGIIDSGYRGSLIAAFRLLSDTPYTVDANARLVQICHPTLCPIFVIFVEESQLSSTVRGGGGFGSTGV